MNLPIPQQNWVALYSILRTIIHSDLYSGSDGQFIPKSWDIGTKWLRFPILLFPVSTASPLLLFPVSRVTLECSYWNKTKLLFLYSDSTSIYWVDSGSSWWRRLRWRLTCLRWCRSCCCDSPAATWCPARISSDWNDKGETIKMQKLRDHDPEKAVYTAVSVVCC